MTDATMMRCEGVHAIASGYSPAAPTPMQAIPSYGITAKQKAVLDFISATPGRLTYQAIADRFGLCSRANAQHYVARLAERGHVTITSEGIRATRLHFVSVPGISRKPSNGQPVACTARYPFRDHATCADWMHPHPSSERKAG